MSATCRRIALSATRLAALVLLATHAVHASSLESALQYMEQGNYSRAYAYTLLLPAAEAGDAEAQYLVGTMIIDEALPGIDQKQGVYWLEKAVQGRHMTAAQTLSKMYLSGYMVPLDVNRGIEYQALANRFRTPDDPTEECD